MYTAICDFIKSVGLRSKFNDPEDPLTQLIPNERFVSEDNKLILAAWYIGNTAIAT